MDETEKLAKAHLASAEVFQQQISESAKLVRHNKIHTAKKVISLSAFLFNWTYPRGCINCFSVCGMLDVASQKIIIS